MTTNVIAVGSDLPLVDAARIMFEKKFNGLPVVDKNGKLIGLITQQDLVSRTHAIHLPTLIDLLSQISVYKKNSSAIRGEIEKITSLRVNDAMNKTPVLVGENSTIAEVAELFSNHHAVNPIPVVGKDGKLAGIVSRFDILKFFVGDSHGHADISNSEPAGNTQIETDKFIQEFENRFLFISKNRAKAWFWLAIGFGIIGFIIAWAIILRVAVQR